MKHPVSRQRGRITRQTLVKMAVRIAVIIVATTAIAYFHMVSNLEDQSLEQLAKYVRERGDRERVIFSVAEDNHAVLKKDILSSLEQLGDTDPLEDFESLFVKQEDGITRNRPARDRRYKRVPGAT